MFEKSEGTVPTVGQYLYDCLSKEGVTEIFGVPGDYNFSLLDILEKYKNINFVNCRNELNAGYAADGYARVKGLGALITTFGVGELSACNAIAGSYSESVPVIHIVGAPKTMVQSEHKIMHHTLLNGDFDVFRKVYENLTEYTAIVTSENAEIEIPKAIQKAKETKKPVYLSVAIDVAEKPMVQKNITMSKQQTNNNSLLAAMKHIQQTVKQAQNPVLLSDVYVLRYNLQTKVQEIVEKMNIPVATMMMGKGSFDESHKNYIGSYAGEFGSAQVRNVIEAADCILAIGPIWNDYNTGSFTAKLNPLNIIEIQPTYVKVGMTVYENIQIQDMLNELLNIVDKRESATPAVTFPYDQGYTELNEDISTKYYYPRFQQMIKENDIVITETGTLGFGLTQIKLAKGVTYIGQGGWGSIGFATPAAFGACIGDRGRRVILFTGDGSHQLTAQEVSSMVYNNCKPIIFLLNNKIYTIEAYINVPTETKYNDIPDWDYTKLLEVYGGNVFTAKVYTNKELDEAIKHAEEQCKEKLCFIEMFADPMDAPTIVHNMHQFLEEKQKQMQ